MDELIPGRRWKGLWDEGRNRVGRHRHGWRSKWPTGCWRAVISHWRCGGRGLEVDRLAVIDWVHQINQIQRDAVDCRCEYLTKVRTDYNLTLLRLFDPALQRLLRQMSG